MELVAKPVWASTMDNTEMNITLAFKAVIKPGNTSIKLTASNAYQLFVNGALAAAGPARACHGHFKLDEMRITQFLTQEENTVVILVASYNTYNFEYANDPGFLLAQIEQEGMVICATGEFGFTCHRLSERLQRVDRYSFQRTFVEIYRLSKGYMDLLYEKSMAEELPVRVLPAVKLLERNVYYLDYNSIYPQTLIAKGRAALPENRDLSMRIYMGETPTIKTFGFNLEDRLCADIEDMTFEKTDVSSEAEREFTLKSGEFNTLSFEHNASGYIACEFDVSKASEVYFIFDEILLDNEINPRRLTCVNGVKLYLEPGKYTFNTFEPYTMKYLKVVVLKGECTFGNLRIIEVAFPKGEIKYDLNFADSELREIAKAALQSFRQNVVDIYMDCPSRERAGWLCDSFFTSRVERLLTGKSVVEREFLQNFILPGEFPFIPKGMLPMCYPADHPDSKFIPNWAMWFVLEMEEYLHRTQDIKMLQAAKPKLYALLDYFAKFENEFELLEKLESWVFLEWSRANDDDVVQDVNYPTNMCYGAVLKAVGRMYEDKALLDKGERIIQTIRRLSFNGEFFVDNAYRRNGVLVPSGITTEVCQYYAFFFDVATPQTHPQLWQVLVSSFGPERKQNNPYPNVHFANAFIGNYLRLELLMRYNENQRTLDNIKGFFLKMARQTGTLWEHDDVSVGWLSFCHGFASHVLIWLDQLRKRGVIN